MIFLMVSWFLASDMFSRHVASFIFLAGALWCLLVLEREEVGGGDKTGFIFLD